MKIHPAVFEFLQTNRAKLMAHCLQRFVANGTKVDILIREDRGTCKMTCS
jgi:hypothetical protein